MKDVVTKERHLSLAGLKPRISRDIDTVIIQEDWERHLLLDAKNNHLWVADPAAGLNKKHPNQNYGKLCLKKKVIFVYIF